MEIWRVSLINFDLVLCTWLFLGCFYGLEVAVLLQQNSFSYGQKEPGFARSCHRRKEEEGILEYWGWDLSFFFCVCFVLGERSLRLVFREGSGIQWARHLYLEYTQFYCTDCTHIPWNKQNIAPLVYVSPGTHSFLLSLFFFGISTAALNGLG